TFRDRVTDMLRLVPELPDAVSYGGGRLLGVHLDGLGDRVAQTQQGRRGLLAPARYDVGELTSTGGRAAVSYETEAEPISLFGGEQPARVNRGPVR
ncbi:MAG: hypothetical protein JWL99_2546, partial [Streptomyces oryziradicis]|nr:hypothetical protein [Actinacidiphila oryziradicis]